MEKVYTTSRNSLFDEPYTLDSSDISTDSDLDSDESESTDSSTDSDLDTEMLSEISNFNKLEPCENLSEDQLSQIQRWKNDVDKIQVSWYPYILEYLPSFKGYVWRLCHLWFSIIPLEYKPIKYLEIGTLCGANVIAIAKTYCNHPDSTIECIDPWEDSNEYSEYKCLQSSNFNNFKYNIEEANLQKKVNYYKDYSYNVVPQMLDNYYDIIYIDGNHESWAVLEDGVMCFRKLKPEGWLVFDDYTFSGETQTGIDSFVKCYNQMIEKYIIENGQLYLKKKKL
jgi:predicted O-methyltransferase YrrM